MPVYRLHEALSGGDNTRLKMGSTSQLAWVSPECIEVLLAKGRISVVVAPPLAVLPGFEERAAEYEKQGIKDVNDLSEAAPGSVEGLNVEDDYEEALKWSAPSADEGDNLDFTITSVAPDIIELTEADDDEPEE